MRVLILGGGGFLGINLTKALIQMNIDVRIFERPACNNKLYLSNIENLEWFEGDFMNRSDIEEAMQDCEIVYHLISTTLPKGSNDNPIYDVESNLVSSIRMLDVAKRLKVKKVIFVSSGGTVYGVPHKTPIYETHPTDPICSYGVTKLAIEKYIAIYHANGGPDYTILRLANPYGQYQSPESAQGVISVFMKKVLMDEPVEIWGDGSIVRDYIYIDDTITAMLNCLYYCAGDKVFNIGSGIGYSLNQILDTMENIFNSKIKRIYSPARKCDIPINVLDITRARKVLNWVPTISLEDGLKKTAKYLRK